MLRSLSIVVLAACGAPAPVTRPVSTRAIAGYPDPVELSSPTCTLHGAWGVGQPKQLRFRAGGKPFARVGITPSATLALGRDGAFVELTTPAIRIWGAVSVAEVILHAAKPVLIAGYLSPGPTAMLRWVGPSAGGATIELVISEEIKPIAPPRAMASCDGLAMEVTAGLAPRDVIPAPPRREAVVSADHPIALSISPNQPPIAMLSYPASNEHRVEVVDERAGQARLVVRAESHDPARDIVVVGWVDAALVHEQTGGSGGSWLTGREAGVPDLHVGGPQRHVACAHEVPLVVELDGEAHLVGAIARDVVIDVLPNASSFVPILIHHGQVQAADGAKLLVLASAIADCGDAGV